MLASRSGLRVLGAVLLAALAQAHAVAAPPAAQTGAPATPSVERFIAGSEPLPLVLDDVTVHVDDARKARTFAVLSDIAERVQILFFTHHARDAELASRAPGGRVIVHELAAKQLFGLGVVGPG